MEDLDLNTGNIGEQLDNYVTFKEIKQQSNMWQQTVEYFEKNKDEFEKFVSRNMGKKDIQVIITGAGSSAFVGNSVAEFLNSQQEALIQSVPTTDLVTNPGFYLRIDRPTLLISCARSGNSPESVAAMMKTEEFVSDVEHIVITCNAEGALVSNAKECAHHLTVLLPEASNDEGFAMTSSFTSMVLSSLLLGSLDILDKQAEMMTHIGEVNTCIIENHLDELIDLATKDVDRVVFLGSNALCGLAEESSLKLLELTNGQVMTSFDTALGFRHGPKSMVKEKTMIVMYFSRNTLAKKYELDLLKELRKDSANQLIVAISYEYDESIDALASTYFSLEPSKKMNLEDMYLMFNYLTFIQLYAVAKSVVLGLNPDNPCPSGEVNRVVQGVTIY